MTNYAGNLRIAHNYLFRFSAPVLIWITGFTIGLLFAFTFIKFDDTLMRSAFLQPVSIVGHISCVLFPLLFAYYSLVTKKPYIFFLIFLVKAISYGFSSATIFHFFGSASWLIQILFLFSDSCCLVILLFWAFHFFINFHTVNPHNFFYFVFASILIIVTDYCVISPFLKEVL